MQPEVAQLVMQARVADLRREGQNSARVLQARGEPPVGGRRFRPRRLRRGGHRTAPAAA